MCGIFAVLLGGSAIRGASKPFKAINGQTQSAEFARKRYMGAWGNPRKGGLSEDPTVNYAKVRGKMRLRSIACGFWFC